MNNSVFLFKKINIQTPYSSINISDTCVVAEEQSTYSGGHSQSQHIGVLEIRHFPFRVQVQVP